MGTEHEVNSPKDQPKFDDGAVLVRYNYISRYKCYAVGPILVHVICIHVPINTPVAIIVCTCVVIYMPVGIIYISAAELFTSLFQGHIQGRTMLLLVGIQDNIHIMFKFHWVTFHVANQFFRSCVTNSNHIIWLWYERMLLVKKDTVLL